MFMNALILSNLTFLCRLVQINLFMQLLENFNDAAFLKSLVHTLE